MTSADYVDVAKKNDEQDAMLAEEDKSLALMEADLSKAEARVEAAEARYLRARRAVERALSEDVDGEGGEKKAKVVTQEAAVNEDAEADRVPKQRDSQTAKNMSARPEKEVSSDKWVAARAAEGRVRERAVKVRERLRRNARDRKFEAAEVPAGDAQAPKKEEAKAEEAGAQPTKREFGLAESAAAKEGAQGIAERLLCLKDRPNAAEKRAALMKVVTGGRENYYTFEPSDVLSDLKERGLLNGQADELLALAAEAVPPPKPAEVPAEGWAAGAKKASTIDRLDDKPFTKSEGFYLKSVEESGLVAAEAELNKAEAELGELVSQAEVRFGVLAFGAEADGGENGAPKRQASGGEPKVDEDYAEHLEAQHDPDSHKESRGSKNTSALNPKVVSKEKWEKAHGKESRDREHEKMARESRRAEARDIKQGATDVGDS